MSHYTRFIAIALLAATSLAFAGVAQAMPNRTENPAVHHTMGSQNDKTPCRQDGMSMNHGNNRHMMNSDRQYHAENNRRSNNQIHMNARHDRHMAGADNRR